MNEEITAIILKALDIVEELRQKSNEAPVDDWDYRCAAADIAALHPDKDFHSRATWCDMLKADQTTKYHERYFNGDFHI